MVAIVRETRGQLVSGMAAAPPARGHALLPPSDRWPQVCARSAGASALFVKLATSGKCEQEARAEVRIYLGGFHMAVPIGGQPILRRTDPGIKNGNAYGCHTVVYIKVHIRQWHAS